VSIQKTPGALLLFQGNREKNLSDLFRFPKIQSAINNHVAAFGWIPVGYADENAWTVENVLDALRKAVNVDASLRLSEIRGHAKRLHQDKTILLKTLHLDSPYKRLASNLSDCVYYKDFLRGVMNNAQFASRPLFIQIARRLNLSFNQVKSYLPEELIDALREKPLLDASFRLSRYVCYPEKGRLVFKDGKKASKIRQTIQSATAAGSKKTLSGVSAMPGVIRGEVRVVHNPSLIHRHDQGFVLVTSMTTPDFVSVIKRSLAVVTDEGGITCHAAIVCRELGVPCVVGTKRATAVFKNGDMVVVDANKGLVRRV
jgi:phosphohistidine swiveling domain-containing protein